MSQQAHQKVQRAIDDIRVGKMVIVVDDEDRENEGDLVMAAEKVTAESINFMARFARGLICMPLTEERITSLDLPMMATHNTSKHETPFTVSIEAREGVTTGISAHDRAHTVQVAIADSTKAADLAQPGHIFPLRAREGGVLVRTGHTEAAVDLARLAGLKPAGVICEVMNDDGTMARLPDLEIFAAEHHLNIISIASLIEYRVTHEALVRRLISTEVEHPTWGTVTLHAFGTSIDSRQHLAVVRGDILSQEAPLVRVHSGYPLSNVLGDIFGGDRAVLSASLRRLGEEDCGVLVCLDQGDPPVSLEQRLRQIGGDNTLQPTEKPENAATQRQIGVGAQILRDLGLQKIRVLSNNAVRLKGLGGYGIEVVAVEPVHASLRLEVVQ